MWLKSGKGRGEGGSVEAPGGLEAEKPRPCFLADSM